MQRCQQLHQQRCQQLCQQLCQQCRGGARWNGSGSDKPPKGTKYRSCCLIRGSPKPPGLLWAALAEEMLCPPSLPPLAEQQRDSSRPDALGTGLAAMQTRLRPQAISRDLVAACRQNEAKHRARWDEEAMQTANHLLAVGAGTTAANGRGRTDGPQ